MNNINMSRINNDSSPELNRTNTNEKKYTLQGLISKIKQSESTTIGNTIVDLSEVFPNPLDSQK
jgi:hypothetical protein